MYLTQTSTQCCWLLVGLEGRRDGDQGETPPNAAAPFGAGGFSCTALLILTILYVPRLFLLSAAALYLLTTETSTELHPKLVRLSLLTSDPAWPSPCSDSANCLKCILGMEQICWQYQLPWPNLISSIKQTFKPPKPVMTLTMKLSLYWKVSTSSAMPAAESGWPKTADFP